MRLALLGHPIGHSLSPSLYKEILGERLARYELLDIEDPKLVPGLEQLAERFDGLNITTPYKRHFFEKVHVTSDIARELGALNTLAFVDGQVYGTNTDAMAVERILRREQEKTKLHLIILGNGVMARMTLLIAQKLGLSLDHFHRGQGIDLTHLDLSGKPREGYQTLVINACSREYSFKGKLHPDLVFWDYNYAFPPHAHSIPSQVKSYWDGKEMLHLQAEAAVEFWEETNPKLKC